MLPCKGVITMNIQNKFICDKWVSMKDCLIRRQHNKSDIDLSFLHKLFDHFSTLFNECKTHIRVPFIEDAGDCREKYRPDQWRYADFYFSGSEIKIGIPPLIGTLFFPEI